jgi:hypothetical protein
MKGDFQMTTEGKKKEGTEVETLTIAEAIQRHRGLDQNYIMRLCIKGRNLMAEYKSRANIPAKEVARALFGKKVGKYWHIPKSELDRLFL